MPPLYKRGPGRPPNLASIASAGEVPPPPGSIRLSKAYYVVNKCGVCKKKGHNARTCSKHTISNAPEPVLTEVVNDEGATVDDVNMANNQSAHANARRGGRSGQVEGAE